MCGAKGAKRNHLSRTQTRSDTAHSGNGGRGASIRRVSIFAHLEVLTYIRELLKPKERQ
jgi:hypothetical protein